MKPLGWTSECRQQEGTTSPAVDSNIALPVMPLVEVYPRPAHVIVLVASITLVAMGTVWVGDGYRIAGAMPTHCYTPVTECSVVRIGEATSARMLAAAGGFARGTGVVLLTCVLVALIGVCVTAARERLGASAPASPGKESVLTRVIDAVGARGFASLIAVGIFLGLAAVFWAAAGSWCGGGDPMPDGSIPGIIYYGDQGFCHGTLSAFPPASIDLATLGGGLFASGLAILVFAL